MSKEIALRIGVFIAVLIVFAVAERLWPRRELTQPRPDRWLANLGVVAVNNLIVRLLFANFVLPVGLAAWAQAHGVGLFNLIEAPAWLEIVLAVILLDLVIYWQHVAFHVIPFLWQLHMSHHVDLDVDLTTGVRFHPLEIVISVLIKLGAVILIGPSVGAVIAFEVILNATAMFNHANLRLPPGLDRRLRLVVVTPDMHRVHHSVQIMENKSNYGFNLAWWDRLFGSYRAQPQDGHQGMMIGLSRFRESKFDRLTWLLALPFMPEARRFAAATASKENFRQKEGRGRFGR